MAITRSGLFSENTVTGSYSYGGSAVGGLTVNGGSVFSMTASDPAAQPAFLTGVGAGGAGTVSVTGTGSKIALQANASSNAGVSGNVGRGGGTGTVNVTAGGAFEIIDNFPTTVATGYANTEGLMIGRDAGSVGAFNFNAGTFSLIGQSPVVGVGRAGGNGTLRLENGSVFSMLSNATGAAAGFDDSIGLQIGRDATSVGLVVIDASSASLQSSAISGAYLQVGRDGAQGTLELFNNASLNMQGVLYSTAIVGRDLGSTGILRVNNSDVDLGITGTNPGANNAELLIGQANGNGEAHFVNGATLDVVAVNATARVMVGRFPTGNGELTVNDSDISITGYMGRFGVGVEGGDGVASITGGATVAVSGTSAAGSSASVFVGNENGSDGDLNISAASSLNILASGAGGFAQLRVGGYGGNGTLDLTGGSIVLVDGGSSQSAGGDVGRAAGSTGLITLNASTLAIEGGTDGQYWFVGREGGANGNMVLQNGSRFTLGLNSAGTYAGFSVGDYEGIGRIQANNSEIIVDAGTDEAYTNIGNRGGNGRVDLMNGSLLRLQDNGTAQNAIINVGGHTGPAYGLLEVVSSDVEIDSNTAFSAFRVGRSADGEAFFRNGSKLSIDGSMALIEVGGRFGGDGYLEINGGSTVQLTSHSADPYQAAIAVGLYGGLGEMIVDGSTVRLTGASQTALVVGTGDEQTALDSGTGILTVRNNAQMLFEGGSGGRVMIGGAAGADGTVNVQSGGLLNLDADGGIDGDLRVGGIEAGAHGRLNIDGATSLVRGFTNAIIGRDYLDVNETSASDGVVALTNGGTFGNGGATIYVGEGGILAASNSGTVFGNVVLTGGEINLDDETSGGLLTINGNLMIENTSSLTNSISLDLSSTTASRINITGHTTINDDLVVFLVPFGASPYRFAAGDKRDLIGFNGGTTIGAGGDVEFVVEGQHANFSAFYGFFAATPTVLSIMALNSGATGGLATLDFGAAAATGANLEYSMVTEVGQAWGGRFAAEGGGLTDQLDAVLGTDRADILVVTNAGDGSQSISINGRGGDDFLQAGSGNDSLLGGAGIDTLIGLAGNDTLDGGSVPDPSNQGNALFGGDGDDTYHVRNTYDLVDEGYVQPIFGFGGTDTVISHANWFWDVYGIGEKLIIAEDAIDPSGAGTTVVGGVFDNEIIGNSKTNIMFGRGGSDTFRAGDGIDYISLSLLGVPEDYYPGVNGVNTIVVEARASGTMSYDIVFEFESGKDKLDVSDYGFASQAEVFARGVDAGDNSYFALGDGFDYLYMIGLNVSELSAGDFVV